jgi:serine/threonine-protein kinase
MFPTEPVPEQIGAYKVIRRLSGAGSADMYLGRMDGPMGFQRICALKLVANSLDDDVRLAEELAREATIIARLNHPAIVRMFDFFEYDHRLVLVLEHVDGADLDRLMQHLARRRQTLRDDAIWYLGHQLCSALAHAHAATDEDGNATPVVHRNLHPENILISWDGQVRLTGFGLGKVLGRTPDTVAGVIKGSPGYMAPEQARGERVTTRADVYGLGLLLWSLLTGKRPPMDGSRPQSVSQLRSDIPREIAAAIDATLEPSADRRKISCQEIEHWLAKITKMEAGRNELREKALLIRAARNPVAEAKSSETTRPPRQTAPRRKVSLRGLRPSQRPPGPGPLTTPRKPSSRPPLRATGSPPSGPPALEMPTAALRQRRPTSIPDVGTIDALLDGGSARASEADRHAGAQAVPQGRLRTMVGGHGAPAGLAHAAPPPAAASETAPALAFTRPAFAGAAADLNERHARGAPPPGPPPLPRSPPGLRDAAGREAAANGPSDLETAGDAITIRPDGSAAAAAWQDLHLASQPSPPIAMRSASAQGADPPPLSAMGSIGIFAATAAVVVAVGIFISERDILLPTTSAGPRTPSSIDATQTPTPTRIAATQEPARVWQPPTAPPQEPTPGVRDPSALPGGVGLITIVFPGQSDVYLNGKAIGPANEALEVRCGRWFVRLGSPTVSGIPEWSTRGETVIVPCQGSITIPMQPNPLHP